MNPENFREEYDAFFEKYLKEAIDSMNLEQNNSYEEPAHLRETFFDSEKEYVTLLLQDESIKDFIIEINGCHNIDEIFGLAQDLVYQVENNLIPYEQMELVEKKLTVLLAAIRDRFLVKVKVKEKYYEEEQEISYGRSR